MRLTRTFLLLLLLGLPLASVAEPYPTDRPIQTHMDLGLFGLLGGGMSYSIAGRPLTRYEDLKDLIYAAGDNSAADMIREAHSAHLTAWIFYGAGVATGVDVALAFPPNHILGVDWCDRVISGAMGAQVFWALGALFDTNAEARKYNAIQRYNARFDRKSEASSAILVPDLAWGEGELRLGFVGRF